MFLTLGNHLKSGRVLAILLVLVLSFQAMAWDMIQGQNQQTAEHLCIQCWVSMQQILGLRFYSPEQQQEALYTKPQEKNAVLVFSSPQAESFRAIEADALNGIVGLLVRSETGASLWQAARARGVNLGLYFQQNLDQQLQPHLGIGKTESTFVLEKSDLHELWSFYSRSSGQDFVYINEFQTLSRAVLSLTHELVHVLDAPSARYIGQRRSQWNALDYFAVEYRAVLFEALVYQELRSKGLIAGKDANLEKVLRGAGFNPNEMGAYRRLADQVLRLVVGSPSSVALEMRGFENEACVQFSYGRRSGGQQGCDLSNEPFDPLTFLSKLAELSQQTEQHYVSYLIKYRVKTDTAGSDSRLGLDDLKANLRAQGSDDFVGYLQAQGLLGAFQVSERGAEGDDQIGPSPRINGGDRLKSNHTLAPRAEKTSRLDEKLLKDEASERPRLDMKKQESTEPNRLRDRLEERR